MILLSCFAGILLLASKARVITSESDEIFDTYVDDVEDFIEPESKSISQLLKIPGASLESTNSCSSVSRRSLLFVSTADGSFTCLNALSGQVLWSISGKQSLVSSSISSIKSIRELEDIKFIPSLNGNLYKWDGDRLETIPLSTDYLLGKVKRLPDGSYIVGGQEVTINGVDLNSGDISYECSLTGCQPIKGNDDIKHKDILSLRRTQKTIRAFEARTGREKWNYSVGNFEIEVIESGNGKIHIEPYCGGSAENTNQFNFIIQEGVVASNNWSFKFGAPIANAWNLEDNQLKLLNIFDAGQFLEQEALNMGSLVYLGLYKGQMYVQHPHYQDKQDSKGNTFAKEFLLDSPQVGHWRPLISTSPSRTPLLNFDKPTTAISSIDYPFDNGIFLYSNTTAIGLPVRLDTKTDKDGEKEVCDAENPDICFVDNKSSSTSESYDFTPITIRDWWKEILALSFILAIGINVAVRMIRKRLYVGPTTQENVVITEVEEAVEEIPQPISTKHVKNSSVSIATDPISEIGEERERNASSSASTLTSSVSNPEFTSRYLVDFEHLECLGKGGFGVVFKAKKKIDDCEYAIKRIYLPRCEEAKGRMMREVKALAALEHPGIVRYFHAWWETPPKDWQFELDRTTLMKDIDEAPSYILSHDWALEVHSLSDHNKIRKPSDNKDEKSAKDDLIEDSLEKCFDFESKSEIDLLRHNDVFYSDDSMDFSHDGTHSESDAHDVTSSSINSDSDASKSSKGMLYRTSTLKAADNDEDSFVVFETNGDIKEENESESESEDEDDMVTERSVHNKTNTNVRSTRRIVGKCCTRSSECLNLPPMFLYIQMQLCKQETLKDWLLKRTPDVSFERSFDIFVQIGDAVEYFHRQGMMHRDLKPANIFFSLDGSVKVGDFGLVTAITRPSKGTSKNRGFLQDENHTGQVGTQLYMSPEQACGKPYSQKVDLYALGLIFFELLTYFSTQMERIRLIYDLKRGSLPDELKETPQGKLVKLLTSEKPDERPEAKELRNHFLIEEMRDSLIPER